MGNKTLPALSHSKLEYPAVTYAKDLTESSTERNLKLASNIVNWKIQVRVEISKIRRRYCIHCNKVHAIIRSILAKRMQRFHEGFINVSCDADFMISRFHKNSTPQVSRVCVLGAHDSGNRNISLRSSEHLQPQPLKFEIFHEPSSHSLKL